MNNCDSPELRSMIKDPTSTGNSGAYPTPATPDLPCSNSKQRRASVNVLSPFNNGRTMPSKWDDADRWIKSPVSGSGVCKALAPLPRRQPKSKSGPLGSNYGDKCFSSYSPGFPLLEGSALTTGVMVPSGYSFEGASSELFIESLYLDSQDDKIDGNNATCVVSRRDVATQMSPVDSPTAETNSRHSARVEVRDVQVDKRVTMTKQPKRHKKRTEKNESADMKDLALTWIPTEGAMDLSKSEKEEARITAWENLQIAKAEASIRKLEMKLEKKKSESMDKIMSKLRIARIKAQEMRKSMSSNDSPRTNLDRYLKISSVGCFCFKQF